MKKLYLLIIVLLTNYTFSHAQSLGSNLPSFDDSIDDIGTLHTKVSAYPNPTNGSFTVSLGADKGQAATIFVLDGNGKMIAYQYIGDCSQNPIANFNLSHLSTGMYVVRVVSGKKFTTMKLLVQA